MVMTPAVKKARAKYRRAGYGEFLALVAGAAVGFLAPGALAAIILLQSFDAQSDWLRGGVLAACLFIGGPLAGMWARRFQIRVPD